MKTGVCFIHGSMAVMLCAIAGVRGQTLPQPGASFQTFMTKCVWTWYGEPKAVYYKGTAEKTYVGYLRTLTNPATVEIASYNHKNGEIDTFLLKSNFGNDDHNHPSIIVRNDGRIMAFYSQHYGAGLFMRISHNAEDITQWDAERVIYPDSFTYPNVYQMSNQGKNGNRIYVFFRGSGGAGQPNLIYSDDGGTTWTPPVEFFQGTTAANDRPYVKYESDGTSVVHMIIERDNRNNGPVPSFYLCFKDSAFYKSDGTLIRTLAQVRGGGGFLTPADVETVYDPANPHLDSNPGLTNLKGSVWDVGIGSDGRPVFLFDIFDNDGTNHWYHYYRYDGTSWRRTFLINSGTFIGAAGTAETGFAGGLTLDHVNPNVIYISAQVNSVFELSRWESPDTGTTWQKTQITSGSGLNQNFRPCVPRGYVGGKVGVIWLCGQYSYYTGPFSCDIRTYSFDQIQSVRQKSAVLVASPFGLDVRRSGISFTLANPRASSLRLYTLGGKLALDCTRQVRSLGAGKNMISWSGTALENGGYVACLDNGASCVSRTVAIVR
jgi:hypothetical protein